MSFKHIRRVDLGLFAALLALVEERGITRAAEQMHLSQPAMSRLLVRLQTLFGDELFVRTKQGYEPTHRALRLYEEIKRLLPRIEELIRDDQFSPATATGTFRLASTDHAASVLLPAFLERTTKLAPNMTVEILMLTDRLFDRLESGAIDLILWPNAVPNQYRTQLLYRDRFVCLVRKGHPLGTKRLTMEQYLAYPHAMIVLTDHRQGIVDQTLQTKKLTRQVQLKIPYFACAAWNIEHSNMILTLPKRLATRLAAISRTKVLEPPIEFPEIEYSQVWHPRVDSDPAHQWFREIMAKVARFR